jgi:hypothetical protein
VWWLSLRSVPREVERLERPFDIDIEKSALASVWIVQLAREQDARVGTFTVEAHRARGCGEVVETFDDVNTGLRLCACASTSVCSYSRSKFAAHRVRGRSFRWSSQGVQAPLASTWGVPSACEPASPLGRVGPSRSAPSSATKMHGRLRPSAQRRKPFRSWLLQALRLRGTSSLFAQRFREVEPRLARSKSARRISPGLRQEVLGWSRVGLGAAARTLTRFPAG